MIVDDDLLRFHDKLARQTSNIFRARIELDLIEIMKKPAKSNGFELYELQHVWLEPPWNVWSWKKNKLKLNVGTNKMAIANIHNVSFTWNNFLARNEVRQKIWQNLDGLGFLSVSIFYVWMKKKNNLSQSQDLAAAA